MPAKSNAAPTLFDQYAATPVADMSPTSKTPPDDDAAESATEQQIGLLPDARRALISLLRNGVVRFDTKRKIFEGLIKHQQAIQQHLADMYLVMLLDEAAGIAMLLQQDINEDGEEEDATSLITRRTLTIYDTLLLLMLRKQYQERETAGEQQVFIDVDWLEEQLMPFTPLTNSERRDKSKLNGALNRMKDRHILAAVRGEEGRLEVTPVIRYVVNAEYLEKMLAEYRDLLAGDANS